MYVRQRHEPAGRRRLDGVLRPRVLWIDPAGGTSIEALAERIGSRARIEPIGLRVWHSPPEKAYGMATEVEAVAAAAAGERVHLVGFSAGGTVALGAALALGDAVRSVTVIEPAFVGDDDWDAVEVEWRSRWREIAALPPADRWTPFRQLLMRPGLEPPAPRNPRRWNAQDELLAQMLVGETGFLSADLAAIEAPVLAIRGGRSSPRWEAVSRRLAAVCADAGEHVFCELHHFTPPFSAEPGALAAVLLDLWR